MSLLLCKYYSVNIFTIQRMKYKPTPVPRKRAAKIKSNRTCFSFKPILSPSQPETPKIIFNFFKSTESY